MTSLTAQYAQPFDVAIQPSSNWTTQDYMAIYSDMVNSGMNPDLSGSSVLQTMIDQNYNPQLSQSELYNVAPFKNLLTSNQPTSEPGFFDLSHLPSDVPQGNFNGGSSPEESKAMAADSADKPGWLASHIANYSLILFGGALALGALLISQREHVETVVKTASKVAEFAA